MATTFEKSFIATCHHEAGVGILRRFDVTYEVVYDVEDRSIVATIEYLGTGDTEREDVTRRVTRRVTARDGLEWCAFERLEDIMRRTVQNNNVRVLTLSDFDHIADVLHDVADKVDAYLYA